MTCNCYRFADSAEADESSELQNASIESNHFRLVHRCIELPSFARVSGACWRRLGFHCPVHGRWVSSVTGGAGLVTILRLVRSPPGPLHVGWGGGQYPPCETRGSEDLGIIAFSTSWSAPRRSRSLPQGSLDVSGGSQKAPRHSLAPIRAREAGPSTAT